MTDGFGGGRVGLARSARAPGGETVMRYLQRHFKVRTRYGGGFVQSIDGALGGAPWCRPDRLVLLRQRDRVLAGRGRVRLHRGDRVWWDRHDWGAAMAIPAVVGSFPEPFRIEARGKRLPVRRRAPARGRRAPAPVKAPPRLCVRGRRALRRTLGNRPLRVFVGPWRELRATRSRG